MTVSWQPPPVDLALGEATVHVWRVPLAPPAAGCAALASASGLDDAVADPGARAVEPAR